LPNGLLTDEFIIERSVFKSGRSELRILDCNRKELSKKTADLKDIKQVSASRRDMPQTSSRRPPSLIRLIAIVLIGPRVCCKGADIFDVLCYWICAVLDRPSFLYSLVHRAQHLNYQVDNPTVVLTQKVAKEFLHNANPKEFYQLFLKATRIDVINAKIMCDYIHA
jgi:hypothetical protein